MLSLVTLCIINTFGNINLIQRAQAQESIINVSGKDNTNLHFTASYFQGNTIPSYLSAKNTDNENIEFLMVTRYLKYDNNSGKKNDIKSDKGNGKNKYSNKKSDKNKAEENNPISLDPKRLFFLVNSYRKKIGFPEFQKDGKICSIAEKRVPELYEEIMVSGEMHKGFYALNLPYFAVENIIYYNSEEGALQWWLNSPIHRGSIEGDFKYSCIACEGRFCSQVFTSFNKVGTD